MLKYQVIQLRQHDHAESKEISAILCVLQGSWLVYASAGPHTVGAPPSVSYITIFIYLKHSNTGTGLIDSNKVNILLIVRTHSVHAVLLI